MTYVIRWIVPQTVDIYVVRRVCGENRISLFRWHYSTTHQMLSNFLFMYLWTQIQRQKTQRTFIIQANREVDFAVGAVLLPMRIEKCHSTFIFLGIFIRFMLKRIDCTRITVNG